MSGSEVSAPPVRQEVAAPQKPTPVVEAPPLPPVPVMTIEAAPPVPVMTVESAPPPEPSLAQPAPRGDDKPKFEYPERSGKFYEIQRDTKGEFIIDGEGIRHDFEYASEEIEF